MFKENCTIIFCWLFTSVSLQTWSYSVFTQYSAVITHLQDVLSHSDYLFQLWTKAERKTLDWSWHGTAAKWLQEIIGQQAWKVFSSLLFKIILVRHYFLPVLTWYTILHGTSHQHVVTKCCFHRNQKGAFPWGLKPGEHAVAVVDNTTDKGCYYCNAISALKRHNERKKNNK